MAGCPERCECVWCGVCFLWRFSEDVVCLLVCAALRVGELADASCLVRLDLVGEGIMMDADELDPDRGDVLWIDSAVVAAKCAGKSSCGLVLMC